MIIEFVTKLLIHTQKGEIDWQIGHGVLDLRVADIDGHMVQIRRTDTTIYLYIDGVSLERSFQLVYSDLYKSVEKYLLSKDGRKEFVQNYK